MQPLLIHLLHPLYPVSDVFNAVFVHGNVLGDAMFYGSGAGKLPTASAVVADIVDIAKHTGKHVWIDWEQEKLELADYKDAEYRFFVRTGADRSAIEAAFGIGYLWILPYMKQALTVFYEGLRPDDAYAFR